MVDESAAGDRRDQRQVAGPALDHAGQQRRDAVGDPLIVDRHRLRAFGGIELRTVHRLPDAGVENGEIDGPEIGRHARDDRCHIRPAGDVERIGRDEWIFTGEAFETLP